MISLSLSLSLSLFKITYRIAGWNASVARIEWYLSSRVQPLFGSRFVFSGRCHRDSR